MIRGKYQLSLSLFLDYVEDIFQTFIKAQTEKSLVAAKQELGIMTPQPMNTMLEKESREEALDKRNRRRSVLVKDVLPTEPGIFKNHKNLFFCKYTKSFCIESFISFQKKLMWMKHQGCKYQPPPRPNQGVQYADNL